MTTSITTLPPVKEVADPTTEPPAKPEAKKRQSGVYSKRSSAALSKRASGSWATWMLAFQPSIAYPELAELNKAEIQAAQREQEVSVTQDSASDEDADVQYPPFWRVALITIALCLAVFCMSLDNTILATSIPKITDEFRSIDDVAWYGSAYLLTTAAFQLFFGKLYTFFSVKTVFLVAIAIFELGSLVCGAAPTSTALIVGRAIAGIGCSGIFSGAFLITAHTVPLSKRPLFTGIVGSMYGVASIAGPIIGGAFTDKVTWRWCFYINLPIGAISIAFIVRFFQNPRRHSKRPGSWRTMLYQLDLAGLTAFVPGIISILLALQWGGTQYEWSNWRVILLLVLFVVLTVIFFAIQAYLKQDATLPLAMLRQRSILGAMLFAGMLGASFYTLIYTLPLWFQAVKSVSAVESGIMNLPTLLAMIIFSVFSGGLVTTFGYYTPFCLASAVFMSAGAGLFTTWHVNTESAKWIGHQIIYGAGVGMGFQQPLIAVQATLPFEEVSIGTALVIFSQNFGGAIFLAASQNIFGNELLTGLLNAFPGLDSSSFQGAGALTISSVVPPQYRDTVIDIYNAALTRTFVVGVATAAATLVGALLLEWRSVKEQDEQVLDFSR